MTVHVVIQPAAGYVAEVLEPSPGVRQLIARSDEAGLTVQVPARVDGVEDTAHQSEEDRPRNGPVRAAGMRAVDAPAGRTAKPSSDAKAA